MKTFKVLVKMTSWLETHIVAADEEAAYEAADNMDGGEFSEYEASWAIEDITEIADG